MIIPINQTKNGVEETIGTADVRAVDGEFVVEFYLRPHYVLSDSVRADLEKSLKGIAAKRFGDLSIG